MLFQSDDVYLEAQIQNVTQSPIYLDRVSLEPSSKYNVTPLNTRPSTTTQHVAVSDELVVCHRLSVCLSVCLSLWLFLCLSISVTLFVCLSGSHLSVSVTVCLSVCLSVCLTVCLSIAHDTRQIKIGRYCRPTKIDRQEKFSNVIEYQKICRRKYWPVIGQRRCLQDANQMKGRSYTEVYRNVWKSPVIMLLFVCFNE